VAGGSTSGCCGIGGKALAWTSTDGLAWTPADVGGGKLAGITALTASGGRFVAAGVVDANESGQDGIVWGSDDGTTWVRVTNSPSLKGYWLKDIAADDQSILVAGQKDPNVGPTTTWIVSGGTWSKASQPVEGVMETVTRTPAGWLAGGRLEAEDRTQPCLWTSTDGLAWTRVDLDLPSGSSRANVVDIAVSQAGIVAVGTADVPSTADTGESTGLVWLSTDGTSWRLIDTGGVFAGQSGGNGSAAVAAASDRFAIVGGTGDP
jgi:hypothetical protein